MEAEEGEKTMNSDGVPGNPDHGAAGNCEVLQHDKGNISEYGFGARRRNTRKWDASGQDQNKMIHDLGEMGHRRMCTTVLGLGRKTSVAKGTMNKRKKRRKLGKHR